MTGVHDGLYAALVERGISRRAFLRFSAAMATALALPAIYAPRIAAAVTQAPRLPVIWLRGQSCGGNTEAFLRAANPTVAELIVDSLSIDYHEALMAPAGAAAALSRAAALERYPNGYVAVVEGAIPTGAGGAYCTVGGRAFADVAREVCDGALATIAVGSCGFDGGISGAGGGTTGAAGVGEVVGNARLVNLPGCPLNVENLTATLVHYLTFGEWPATDSGHRPLFAYGALIHNQCERRPHFEFGEFVLAWGDEGAQKGWCLYKMGCKGPEAMANCPTVRYAEGTSWPVRAGHGCVGCTMPNFWDAMTPAYRRLPSPLPFAMLSSVTPDQVGQVMVGGVAAVTAGHGAASYVRHRRTVRAERRAGRATPPAAAVVETEATESPVLEPAMPASPAPQGSPTIEASIEEQSGPPEAERIDVVAAEPAVSPAGTASSVDAAGAPDETCVPNEARAVDGEAD